MSARFRRTHARGRNRLRAVLRGSAHWHGCKWLAGLLLCCAAFAGTCRASAAATRSVVDEVGRTVVLPVHPHRIVSLVPSITDTVFALGAGEDVVAVSDYVKYPEAATHKPSVGTIMDPSVERILSFHPDLLLAQKHQSQKSIVDVAERLGIPVYVCDPHGLAGLFASITDLGRAIGREREASMLTTRLKERVAAVRASVQGKPVVSVFLPLSYDPVITIGKGSYITELIALAGGRSVTDELGQEWPEVSMEAVIARAPQALLLERDGTTTLAALRRRPGWNSLPAVRTGRVYALDPKASFISPMAIDALEELARELHKTSN